MEGRKSGAWISVGIFCGALTQRSFPKVETCLGSRSATCLLRPGDTNRTSPEPPPTSRRDQVDLFYCSPLQPHSFELFPFHSIKMSMPGPPPGMQQPSPEQIRQLQAQLQAEAAKHGLSVQEYVQKIREEQMRMQQQAQQQQQGGQQEDGEEAPQQQQQGGMQQQQVPINPGPPKPEALAVANFLRGQQLKPRTCIFQEKRKELFKGTWLRSSH